MLQAGARMAIVMVAAVMIAMLWVETATAITELTCEHLTTSCQDCAAGEPITLHDYDCPPLQPSRSYVYCVAKDSDPQFWWCFGAAPPHLSGSVWSLTDTIAITDPGAYRVCVYEKRPSPNHPLRTLACAYFSVE